MKQKTDNQKAMPKFLLILLCSCILGGIGGFAAAWVRYHGGENLPELFRECLAAMAPWGIPVSTLFLLIPSLLCYRKAKSLVKTWDGEAEEPIEQAERKLNLSLLLTSILLILCFFCFSMAMTLPLEQGEFFVFLSFFAVVILIIRVQQKIVDLTKVINPEKKGSVYDMKFQKKWLDSCDENERQTIGEASYKAYMAMTKTCVLLWTVFVILSMVYPMSILPVLTLTVIWLVGTVSYSWTCMQKGKK